MSNIDPDKLRPPSPESEVALSDALRTLEPYAERYYTRGLELHAGDPTSSGELVVYASQNNYGNSRRGSLSFRFHDDEKDEQLFIYAGDPEAQSAETRSELRAKIVELANGLEPEPRSWLLEAWASCTNTAEDQLYDKIKQLLDISPFPFIEYTHYSLINYQLSEGNSVAMDWWAEMNQEVTDNFPPEMTTVHIHLKFPGQEISYFQYMNGLVELNVKNPTQEVPREVLETGPITFQEGPLTIGVNGSEEFMRRMHAAFQELRENRDLGILQPTQEKMDALLFGLEKLRNIFAALQREI
jgi:hypothetical protein